MFRTINFMKTTLWMIISGSKKFSQYDYHGSRMVRLSQFHGYCPTQQGYAVAIHTVGDFCFFYHKLTGTTWIFINACWFEMS